ncbi:hypothetical protein RLEG12_04370 (plasmid) [Rhizobium leguminosarum bv. trifolii CB782]|nr:hypothetical protein RLEG12_04370 [Rhizobium leguminosarum bv. trifolii CB782]
MIRYKVDVAGQPRKWLLLCGSGHSRLFFEQRL